MNTQMENLHTIITSALLGQKRIFNKMPQKNELSLLKEIELTPDAVAENERLIWHIRFEPIPTGTPIDLCLEVDHDVILGAEDAQQEVINLVKDNDQILGVSRRHLRLFPTKTDLVIVDLATTNGTRKNGRSIQPNTPYPLDNGDILALGDLTLAVTIKRVTSEQSNPFADRRNVANSLAHLSTAINSNLSIHNALSRILEITAQLCQADKVALFLWNEHKNELTLSAEHGMRDDKDRLATIPVNHGLLIDEVLRKKEPLRNVKFNGQTCEVVPGYPVNAALYTPVLMGETCLGILIAMQTNQATSFSPEDRLTLSTVARFAALAIQNSQSSVTANSQLQSKVDELSIRNAISTALSRTNNLTGIYNVLRDQVRARWKVETIGLWLMEEGKDCLMPFPKPSFYRPYSLGEGIIGSVASSKESILAQDIKLFSEPTNSHEPTLQLIARSAICVPLIENDKVLGVFAVFSARENEFKQSDIRLLEIFGQASSAAIRNAWLFEQIDKQRATILAAVNMLPQPMMIVDDEGKIIVANKAADAMLNEIHSCTGRKEDNNPEVSLSLVTLLRGLSESKWSTKEIVVGDKAYVATLEYASMVGTVIVMQDVSDPITGTSNQRHFHDLAEQAFQQAKRYTKPLSAIVIDLDNLQQVIQGHGREAANQVLKKVAKDLRSFLRTPDILGRYQENEFIVLLPETNQEQAQIVCERMTKSISNKPIMIGNSKIVPKLLLGLAALDTGTDESIDSFIEKAYGALTVVKNKHKQSKLFFHLG